MDAKAKVVRPEAEHWLFTLCDEAGVPLCTKYLTFKPANPFGIPGEEFDESYSVKSLQLVPESMRAEARRTAEYWKAEHLAGNEKLSTLLTGLEALAGRWERYGTGDYPVEQLLEVIASAGLEGDLG